jgi:hypothetical protein
MLGRAEKGATMGLLDKLSEGVDKVAKEAEKAIGQGKQKVDQLQLERQMDTAARKLGYLEFDRSRGRAADDAVRESLLADLARLEDEHMASTGTARGPETAPETGPDATAAPTDGGSGPQAS